MEQFNRKSHPGSRRGIGKKDKRDGQKANAKVNNLIDSLWATEV